MTSCQNILNQLIGLLKLLIQQAFWKLNKIQCYSNKRLFVIKLKKKTDKICSKKNINPTKTFFLVSTYSIWLKILDKER